MMHRYANTHARRAAARSFRKLNGAYPWAREFRDKLFALASRARIASGLERMHVYRYRRVKAKRANPRIP